MKNIKFNSCFSLLFAAAIVASTGCNFSLVMHDGYVFNKQGETAEATEEWEFSPDINQIVVVNQHGNVKVELATGEPSWTWNKKVWADSQEMADVLLDELQMEVETVDGTQTWTVVLPEPGSDLNGIESNLVFSIPPDVDVDLGNSFGDLEIENVDSLVKLDNRHGAIRLSELTNEVTASNQHGDFTAVGLAGATIEVRHGNSKIESVTGDISLDQAHGDAKLDSIEGNLKFDGSHSDVVVANAKGVEIKTSHGSIEISDVAGSASLKNSHGSISGVCYGNVDATNQHGDVNLTTNGEVIKVHTEHGDADLTITNELFKSINIKASFDDIKLHLPASSDPSIEMNASHGKVSSKFDSNKNSDQKVVLKNSHGDIRVKKSSEVE